MSVKLKKEDLNIYILIITFITNLMVGAGFVSETADFSTSLALVFLGIPFCIILNAYST